VANVQDGGFTGSPLRSGGRDYSGHGKSHRRTMAVIMVAGNAADLPASWLAPVRTLTSNIALEMAYASGEHRQALFATGVVLFVIIMILNFLANLLGVDNSHEFVS